MARKKHWYYLKGLVIQVFKDGIQKVKNAKRVIYK